MDYDYGTVGGMNDWQGEPKYSEKSSSNAALFTTNPTWLESGSNPGHRDGKPVTKRLSYGTVECLIKIMCRYIWEYRRLILLLSLVSTRNIEAFFLLSLCNKAPVMKQAKVLSQKLPSVRELHVLTSFCPLSFREHFRRET
jgi:hypothetical protein